MSFPIACALLAPLFLARSSAALQDAGLLYPVDRVSVRVRPEDHPGLPTSSDLRRLRVELVRTEDGWRGITEGAEPDSVTTRQINDIGDAGLVMLDAPALLAIAECMHAELASRGLLGIFVEVDPKDIGRDGVDRRDPDDGTVTFLVTAAVVGRTRSRATGERFPAEDADDLPAHARIRARSPARPAIADGSGGSASGDDLLTRAIDDYVYRLSRHPGRRVDALVEPGEEEGTVDLTYLVTERRLPMLYAQIANTGTESTSKWRERFGIIHPQLTDNDDLLSLDYTTAGFDEVNAFVGSYELPVPWGETARLRVHGHWSEYTATELGFARDAFDGESWSVGGTLVFSLGQWNESFLDAELGLRTERIEVNNRIVDITGDEDFTIARFGLRFERRTGTGDISAVIAAEWNDGQENEPDRGGLARLGRIFADTDFGVLRADVRGATYLDAEDALAHEVAFVVRGQYAFDNRLVPQFQQVAGGARSVRGYPESAIAGDHAVLASAEYRYHLPRAFAPEPQPRTLFGQPFRYAPQAVGGRTDWDLVLRGFVDIGRTFVNDRQFFEDDATLIGAGVGAGLLLGRSLEVTLDWGFALRELESRDVDAGDQELHVAVTWLY